MLHRYRKTLALAAVLVSAAALWRPEFAGPGAVDPARSPPARAHAAAVEPAAARDPAAAEPTAATPAGEPREEPAAQPASATAHEPAAESAPDESLPGRRLAELEGLARTGDRKAARDWVDALGQCVDVVFGDRRSPPARFRSHLDWNLVGARRGPRADLHGAWVDDCRQLFPDPDGEAAGLLAQSMIEDALRQWAATGDPLGQLAASMIAVQWPPPLDVWRQQQAWATAHLAPADPQTLVDLAQVFAHGSRFPSAEAWRLAACDLGYDCSAGGALQARLCQISEICSNAPYEEEQLQSMPPRQWQIVQRQRRELLEWLRRGDIRGLFDVPPPGGG